MKVELEDCKAWINEHPYWILPQDCGDTAIPMIEYRAEHLVTVFNDMLLPYLDEKNVIKTSLHDMLLKFWDEPFGGLQSLESWFKLRCVRQIIYHFVNGQMDSYEIIDALYPVLALDRKSEHSKKIIYYAIKDFNDHQPDSKVDDFEWLLDSDNKNEVKTEN